MDWGFVKVNAPDGISYQCACFAMICHHCGERYIEFFPNARQETLFIGMIHAFIYIGIISSRTCKTKNGCPCCNGGIAKRIGCFDKEENLIMFFDSARQATNKFDVEPSFVCSCCRNEKWALGYHWKYIVNN